MKFWAVQGEGLESKGYFVIMSVQYSRAMRRGVCVGGWGFVWYSRGRDLCLYESFLTGIPLKKKPLWFLCG